MIVDGDKFIRAINLLPCYIISAVTTKKHYYNSLGFSLDESEGNGEGATGDTFKRWIRLYKLVSTVGGSINILQN